MNLTFAVSPSYLSNETKICILLLKYLGLYLWVIPNSHFAHLWSIFSGISYFLTLLIVVLKFLKFASLKVYDTLDSKSDLAFRRGCFYFLGLRKITNFLS